ncbi:MAG: DDE-type integrase/transposase/recombinase [Candidatus Thermoplasmatota archaeon]|jgi:transposase InsO family protein|nr:DDE-type integrase/transposase/recombinase [Candidatus Thermoplasmatota archaeon]MCL5984061.1 DDE-type integrase/transposase/recombinase [Candidatus Thermoplasmatota archaeon]
MKPLFENPYVLARLKFVLAILDGELTLHEASRHSRLSRTAIRIWISRYKALGVEGLRNRPRGGSLPTSSEVEEAVLRLKRERRGRSCRKIRDLLKEEGVVLHRQTIYRILRKHGEHRREPKQLKPDHDFEYPEPNDCWQIDIMDGIIVKGLGLVYLHSILDDHSRDVMGAEWFTGKGAKNILRVVREAFEKNGLPKHILADHGTEFKAQLGHGLTQYEKVLQRLGVDAIYASIGKPRAKGKKERFYRFVQEDFLQEYDFTSLEDVNRKWATWVQWYRTQHEHSSLNGAAPGERYARVRKRFSPFPLEDVFATIVERKVRRNATVSYGRNPYPVDPKYIGEKVELRILDNHVRIFSGVTLVGTYDSRIDWRERMLRRLHTRRVKQDGTVRFQGRRYRVGVKLTHQRLEILRHGHEVRVYLPGNRAKVFILKRRYRRHR